MKKLKVRGEEWEQKTGRFFACCSNLPFLKHLCLSQSLAFGKVTLPEVRPRGL